MKPQSEAQWQLNKFCNRIEPQAISLSVLPLLLDEQVDSRLAVSGVFLEAIIPLDPALRSIALLIERFSAEWMLAEANQQNSVKNDAFGYETCLVEVTL